MTLTLRKKTLFVVTITLVVLVVILYFVSRTIVLGSFDELEQDDVGRHVERVNEALDNELNQMTIKAKDYALPGGPEDLDRLVAALDVYSTTVIPDPDDPDGKGKSGVVDLLVDRLGGLNVFMITDAAGSILWERGYDEEQGKVTLVPKSLRSKITEPNSAFIQHPGGDTSLRGIVLLDEGPMLVVSEYKLPRGGEGSFVGTVLMGKFLDESEVARLAELTRLDVSAYSLGGAQLPADVQEARDLLSAESPTHVEPLDDDFVAGYAQLSDVSGAPALLWRVTVPRDIMDEGRQSINFLLVALAVVGLVLVVVIAFLLDRLVLSRMARLSSQVSAIDTNADLTTRVTVPGKDELSSLGVAINSMLGDIQTERGKSDNLLLNVLPAPIADRLKQGETTIADNYGEVTVPFSDVVGFTKLSAQIGPTELVNMLNQVFSAFDRLSDTHGLEKIKTIGDAYMVVGGLPNPREDHAEAVAEMALDMHEALQRLNAEHGTTLNIRVGMNSGPVVAGVIGEKKFIYDLWGDTVNTAARMESHGVEGGVQMTEETYRLLEGKFDIENRGIIDVKGKGDMNTFILKGRLATATR